MKKLVAPFVAAGLLLFAVAAFAQPAAKGDMSKEEINGKIAHAGNDSTKAYWQSEMARKLVTEKKYDEAIGFFYQSLAYQEKTNNVAVIAKTKANLASCYMGKLDMKRSQVLLEEARVMAEKTKDKGLLYHVYKGLIATNNSLGSSANGLAYAQKLLRLGETEKDESIIGMGYYNIGYFHHLNNNPDRTYANYFAALQHFQRADDTTMVARVQINIGEYFQTVNQFDSAKAYFKRSLETAERLGDKESMAGLYERLGNFYVADEDYDSYFKNLDKSVAIAKELDDKSMIASYEFSKERMSFYRLTKEMVLVGDKPVPNADQKKQLEEIIRQTKLTIENYRQLTVNYLDLSKMTEWLSGMQELTGDYKGALESYLKHVNYKDSFSSEENKRQFASVAASYAFEKSRDSLQLAEEQKRLQLQKEMELKALKFEFEQKRAQAKSEAERQQLVFEEELKRKTIEAEYVRNREASKQKYEQEKALAQANEEKQRALSLAELRKSNNARNVSLLSAGLLLASAGLFGYGYAQKRKDNKKIATEKQRSDELLLNILPAEVAEELKSNGHSKAQQYGNVSVLFTDFVDFTKISERLGVEELVTELNINFTAFDRIMEKYGLEKIKTIGDAYLAVSGLPVEHPDHAKRAVRAAIDILDFVEERKKQVSYGLDIRIGINSGTVIAGIIGVKKFAYDIWGDTVNVAARMEQSGQRGKLNISENTYQLVKEEFACTYRGKVDAKNKGEMDMYFVERSVNAIINN